MGVIKINTLAKKLNITVEGVLYRAKKLKIDHSKNRYGEKLFMQSEANRITNYKEEIAIMTSLERIKLVLNFYYLRGINSERCNKLYYKILFNQNK